MTEEESNLRGTLKKILRALRAVLISEMDYQVELQEMKASRFKLIFIVLMTATVTWAVAFHTSGGYIHLGIGRMGIALLAGWAIFILTWLTRKKENKRGDEGGEREHEESWTEEKRSLISDRNCDVDGSYRSSSSSNSLLRPHAILPVL